MPGESPLVIVALISFCLVGLSVSYQQDPPNYAAHQSRRDAKAQRSRRISTESQVVARMFSGEYDPDVRPPVRDSADHSAIVVITSIFLNRVIWHKHSAEVDLYLRQHWEDSRLIYEVDTREGIHEVSVPKNRKLWRPDTFFVGAQEESVPSGEVRSRTVVEPSGFVRASEKRRVRVSFDSDSSFPMSNTRAFKLTLSSYSYPVEDVVYLWANSPPTVQPIDVADDLGGVDATAPFTFQEAEAGDCVGNYTSGVYACVEVSVYFSGKAADGWLKVILPCILLIVASWLHFWVHGSWSVPRTVSAALPFFIFVCLLLFFIIDSCALLVWLLICTLFTFLSLVEYFVVIGCTMHHRYSTKFTPLQQQTTTVITNDHPIPAGKHLSPQQQQQMQLQQHQQLQQTRTLLVEDEEPAIVEMERRENRATSRLSANNIDRVSRVAFPIAFLIFLVIYFIYYHIVSSNKTADSA